MPPSPRVALGWKAHSGWAALVVVTERDGGLAVVDRRRVELVDEAWAKAPFHAAESLEPVKARQLVARGIESAGRVTAREVCAVVERERARGNDVVASAVLVGTPMPEWTVDEIRSVHFRMHKAEGALFKNALLDASRKARVSAVAVPEKELARRAADALGARAKRVAALGKEIGPPWTADQKDAALAAWVALRGEG